MTTLLADADNATFTTRDFRLQSDEVLPEVTIAYRTMGTLSPMRDNVVLVTHGNTSGPHMIDPNSSAGEGAWNEIVGPGKAVDTDQVFRDLPEHAGLVLWLDQCRQHRSAHRQTLWATFPRHHRD